jgi:hypothetical protein
MKPFQREHKGKEKLDVDMRCEIMRKKLCFNCRYPWVPDHKFMGKGQIHYIEVATDNHEKEHGSQAQDSESNNSEEEPLHEEENPPRIPPTLVGE